MENYQQNEQQIAQNQFNNPGQGINDEGTDATGSDLAMGDDADQPAFTNDESVDTDDDTDENDEDADFMRGQE